MRPAMGPNRVFFPQAAVDQWLSEGRLEVIERELCISSHPRRYRLVEAAYVVAEVTGAPDDDDLVGRVKSLTYLEALGAEVLGDSMILGDSAYDLVPGWVGTLVPPVEPVERPELTEPEEEQLKRLLPPLSA